MTSFWIGLILVPIPAIAFVVLNRIGGLRSLVAIALVTVACVVGLYFLETKLIWASLMVLVAALATGLGDKPERVKQSA